MKTQTIRELCATQERIYATRDRARVISVLLPFMPWHLRLYARFMVWIAMSSIGFTQRNVDRQMKVYTRD